MPEKVSGSLNSYKRSHDLLIFPLKKDHNNEKFNLYHLIVDTRPLLDSKLFNIRLISG